MARLRRSRRILRHNASGRGGCRCIPPRWLAPAYESKSFGEDQCGRRVTGIWQIRENGAPSLLRSGSAGALGDRCVRARIARRPVGGSRRLGRGRSRVRLRVRDLLFEGFDPEKKAFQLYFRGSQGGAQSREFRHRSFHVLDYLWRLVHVGFFESRGGLGRMPCSAFIRRLPVNFATEAFRPRLLIFHGGSEMLRHRDGSPRPLPGEVIHAEIIAAPRFRAREPTTRRPIPEWALSRYHRHRDVGGRPAVVAQVGGFFPGGFPRGGIRGHPHGAGFAGLPRGNPPEELQDPRAVPRPRGNHRAAPDLRGPAGSPYVAGVHERDGRARAFGKIGLARRSIRFSARRR